MHTHLHALPCQSLHGRLEFPEACQKLESAITTLKERLLSKYEREQPEHHGLIQQAVEQAEELSWQTSFPHLFFPEFAEVCLAGLVGAAPGELQQAA
jgi:hypothetical protein